MKDLSRIPDADLLADRAESVKDIRVCGDALAAGINEHRDGLAVTERIRGNTNIIDRIDAEQARRRAGS